MAARQYRCGNSSEVFSTIEPVRAEVEAVRLLTPLRTAATEFGLGLRVVVDRENAPSALLCLGATRAQAVAHAFEAALPARALGLRLQRWVGSACSGWWEDLRVERGELPHVPPPPPRGLRRCLDQARAERRRARRQGR